MGKKNSANVQFPLPGTNWDSWLYRLGCPVWGCKDWVKIIYPDGTTPDQFLGWYSHRFSTVEGNSTFYAVPPLDTFRKWADQSSEGFRFCFKFPRTISHDAMLRHCDRDLGQWLESLEILDQKKKLGPTFLQLGPSFSPQLFSTLETFLRKLPQNWPWAIEVRHLDWFDAAENEERLDGLLHELRIDRVLFDSRPLNSNQPSDDSEVKSQLRKPKSPFRTTVTGTRPMVRLIGRNDLSEVEIYWDQWASKIAEWISQGLSPWVFTHAPDDRYAPELALALHARVRRRLGEMQIDIPDLPTPLSGALLSNDVHEPEMEYKQLDLF